MAPLPLATLLLTGLAPFALAPLTGELPGEWPNRQDDPAPQAETSQEPGDEDSAPQEPTPGEEGQAATESEEPEPKTLGEDAARWMGRVEQMLLDIETDAATPEDAELLYDELLAHLRVEQQHLRTVLRTVRTTGQRASEEEGDEEIGTVADLHASMWVLFEARIRLLDALPPERHHRVTGAGVEGMRELRGELAFVTTHLRYQRLQVPEGIARIARDFQAAPLPALRAVILVILALVAFRYWRKWAKEGLERAREFLTKISISKDKGSQPLVQVLWYLDRVRRPVEWLFLINAVIAAYDWGAIPEVEWVVETVASWILEAWFAVAVVSAFASRSIWNDSPRRAKLRTRSLRIVAAWLVFLGLGLELTEHFARHGTLHAWVGKMFQFMALPLGLLLLVIWRNEVSKRLQREAPHSPTAARLVTSSGGARALLTTVLGAGYLVVRWFQRLFLRGLAKFEGGRRLLGEARRREVSRLRAEGEESGVKPLSKKLRQRILKGRGEVIEGVGVEALERISAQIEQGRGAVAVTSERGGGKTNLLRRLAAEYGDEAIYMQCPFDGLAGCLRELGRAVGLEGDVSEEDLSRRIAELSPRLIIVDDLHRLTRPVIGGQAGLDRMAEISLRGSQGIVWIVGLTSAAFQYVSMARDGKALEGACELAPWTEQQLRSLVESRCTAADIDPDFGRLVFRRSLEDVDLDDPVELNRLRFYRILWLASGGNPDAALRLWVDALGIDPQGEVFVRHLLEPPTAGFDDLHINVLLILRFLILTERASAEEVAQGLQVSGTQALNALLYATRRGWVEEFDGSYEVTQRWYRPIAKVLARKNLMTLRPVAQASRLQSFVGRQLKQGGLA